MKIRLIFTVVFGMTGYFVQAQNDTIFPSDTLVNPSYFASANILSDWELGYCAVATSGADTTFAPCYIVTYKDHYNTSIDLCPDNLDSVGGVGLFNGTPRLLDSVLFGDMEADGSNIISNADGTSINFKNLTSGTNTDGGGMNPKYCIEADLYEGTNNTWYQEFHILLGPIDDAKPPQPYSTAAKIGVLKDGILLEHTPPSSESTVALNGGIIPVDRCGWHPEPAGFGHFHATPYAINKPLSMNGVASQYQCNDMTQDNDGLMGFTFEGVPMYGPYDDGQSTVPGGLDPCNGHTSATPEFPGGVYHYHTFEDSIINNPKCTQYYTPIDAFFYGEWVEDTTSTDTTDTTNNPNAIKMYFENSEMLSVYPTVTSGKFVNIRGEFDQLSMFDITGNKIKIVSVKTGELDRQIWFGKLEKGVYFIKARKRELVLFERILIE